MNFEQLQIFSRVKTLIAYTLVFILSVSFSSNEEISNTTNENFSDVKIGLKVINFFEKIPENACPNEYEACYCDYSTLRHGNTNNNENSSPYKTNSFSIMIDCQYLGSSEPAETSSSINKTSNRSGHAKSLLLEIPNVSNALAKFRYLGHITHLDLSHTGISEVPTDAFKVTLNSGR